MQIYLVLFNADLFHITIENIKASIVTHLTILSIIRQFVTTVE
jgi:hypothetical protein